MVSPDGFSLAISATEVLLILTLVWSIKVLALFRLMYFTTAGIVIRQAFYQVQSTTGEGRHTSVETLD